MMKPIEVNCPCGGKVSLEEPDKHKTCPGCKRIYWLVVAMRVPDKSGPVWRHKKEATNVP